MKKVVLFLGFIMLFAFSQFTFAQELLTNVGFENWTVNGAAGPPDDWELYPATSFSASQEATTIHGGIYSTNLTWTTTNNRDFQQIDISPITGGNSYSLTIWIYDNDVEGKIRPYIRWEDSGGGYISNSYMDYSTDIDAWTEYSTGLIAAPATAVQCEVRVRCYDDTGWISSASVYVDDISLQASTTSEISKAYSISDTEIDVVYTMDVTSVNPTDYTLTGTASITFSGATIDGTDAKIVHLTGASSSVTGDITLDNIDDSANGSDYDFYAGIMPIAYTNTNNPGGTVDGTHFASYIGIVSADDENSGVWISDNFGAYNGVLIFDYDFGDIVDVGDEILVFGKRSPYNNLTELVDPELISTISTGNSPYGPDVISGSDIDETLAADTDPGETWEGQLVRIEDVYVESYVDYDYRCTDDGGTTYFHVGDNVDYHFGTITLTVGVIYDAIIGVVDWNYTDENYRINPRDIADIISVTNTPPSVTTSYIPDPPGQNQQVIVTSEVIDADGIAGVWIFYKLNGIMVADWEVMTDIGANLYRYTIPGYSVGDLVEFKIKATDNGLPPLTTYDPGVLDFYSYIVVQLPSEGDIIINEIMQNPSVVGDSNGEYMEFYNTTDHDIDINGWTVRDNGTDSFVITNGAPLIISSYGYLVIGNDGNSGTNGGYTCDYEYSGMYLGNSDDEVILEYTGVIIDSVYYDNGATFPDPTGASMELDPTHMNYVDNDDGANWYTAHTTFGDGDNGSPGSANSGPLPDAPTDLVVTVNGNNIDLNWTVVSGATGYNIYRSTDPYNFGSTAHDTSVTNSYTDIGAASDDKYFYRVTATN
jgi:hypothetical protein